MSLQCLDQYFLISQRAWITSEGLPSAFTNHLSVCDKGENNTFWRWVYMYYSAKWLCESAYFPLNMHSSSWTRHFIDKPTIPFIKCNINFPSATNNSVLQGNCYALFSGGKFLSAHTEAELQRDIVHLTKISCLCRKNTLSCGGAITGI